MFYSDQHLTRYVFKWFLLTGMFFMFQSNAHFIPPGIEKPVVVTKMNVTLSADHRV
ncbi:putative dihydrolipoyllysine-residue acetyltransferase [Helianthus annuus]|nr:putative dihydrolipoyllysine-residue acetyltransferase [Helianthus annuus]